MHILALILSAIDPTQKTPDAPTLLPAQLNSGELEIILYRAAAITTTFFGLSRWIIFDFLTAKSEIKKRTKEMRAEGQDGHPLEEK